MIICTLLFVCGSSSSEVLTGRFSLRFSLPAAKVANPDITRIINSDEIRAVIRPAQPAPRVVRRRTPKKNPLVNKSALYRLNPYARTHRANEIGMSFLFFP